MVVLEGRPHRTHPRKETAMRTPRSSALSLKTVALAFVVLLLLGLSGCKMVVGADTKVNGDGSGTIAVRLAADSELQAALGQQGAGGGLEGALDAMEQQVGEGWTRTEGTDPDGTRWVQIDRRFADPTELQAITGGDDPVGSLFSSYSVQQSKSLFSVETVFAGTMDSTGATDEPDLRDQLAQLPAQLLSSVIQVENRVSLPGSIKANNANEVQGNTLIWRQAGTAGAIDMQARSLAYRWGVIAAFVVPVVLVLVLIALALLVVLPRRRRPQAAAAAGGGAYAAGPAGSADTAGPLGTDPPGEPAPPAQTEALGAAATTGDDRALGAAATTGDDRALGAAATTGDDRALGASPGAAPDRALPPAGGDDPPDS